MNVGRVDRVVRLIFGVSFAISATLYSVNWFLFFSAYFILTALIGFAPEYLPFNFTTRFGK